MYIKDARCKQTDHNERFWRRHCAGLKKKKETLLQWIKQVFQEGIIYLRHIHRNHDTRWITAQNAVIALVSFKD